MKYYVISENDHRLDFFQNKIKEFDNTAEIFTEERVDYFFDESFHIIGPAKIIVDNSYDDFLEQEDLGTIGSDLICNEFNHSTGEIDIYVFDDYLHFFESTYRFKNCEVRIHKISEMTTFCLNIFKELHKNSFSPKKVILYNSNYENLTDACKRFLSSEIITSKIVPYTNHDVADFYFYTASDSNDAIIVFPDVSNITFYLQGVSKLGYKGRIFFAKKAHLEEAKKLNLPNPLVFIPMDSIDYLLDDPIYNKFGFVKLVKKYLSFLTGASNDIVDETIDTILSNYNFSLLPIIYEELKYVYERNKNNEGITYYDFSNTRELVKKIDSGEITNIEAFNELDKSAKYITGIPPVMVQRFYRLGSVLKKHKNDRFDKEILDFVKGVIDFPHIYVQDNIMVAYAMFLAMVSLIK